jgi:hypothetical protein
MYPILVRCKLPAAPDPFIQLDVSQSLIIVDCLGVTIFEEKKYKYQAWRDYFFSPLLFFGYKRTCIFAGMPTSLFIKTRLTKHFTMYDRLNLLAYSNAQIFKPQHVTNGTLYLTIRV